MAVPTITTVAPVTIWTGGQYITITGTGFRVPVIPSYDLDAPYPAPIPTIQVTVDGVPANNVRLKSDTLLECSAPRHDVGAGAITIQNLDDAGAPIVGESVTLPNALTYARPDLTDEPDFGRVDRQVIRELKRQIIDNVERFRSIDYSESPFEFTALAKLPALVLSGPDMQEDRPFFASNEPIYTGGDPALSFQKRRTPVTCSLTYGLSGITNSTQQLLALQALVIQFFNRNSKLSIARDPNDASKGTIEYQMYSPIDTVFKNTTVANTEDIRQFSGSFIVRGVNLEELASFPGEGLLETGFTAETITLKPSTSF